MSNALLRAAVALALLPGAAGITEATRSDPELPELDQVLRRLDRIGRLYRDNALRFTCNETITVRGTTGKRVHKYRYIYVYDQRRGLLDYRTSRRGGKPLRNEETQAGLLRAYSWIWIFEAAKRDLYSFELTESREVLERPAIGVRFSPVPPYAADVNDWFGTAWFDRETFQPLRVEALTVEHQRRREKLEQSLRKAARSSKRYRSSHLVEQVTTEFTAEKNGMRFPGDVLIRLTRYEVRGGGGSSGYREYPVYRLQQAYDDYRFFGVRTQAEIERILTDP